MPRSEQSTSAQTTKLQEQLERWDRLRKDPRWKGFRKRGYVAYAEGNGEVGWAPWTESTVPGGRMPSARQHLSQEEIQQMKEEGPWKVPPIQRRQPLERVESLIKRLVDFTVEGDEISSEVGHARREMLMKEIQGEYWKVGTPVSMEDLRRVASDLLRKAERKARK